jgi:dTMP kinase
MVGGIMKKGVFLVFEGIDGSGKGTVIEKVEEHIQQCNIDYISVRDPGSTYIGDQIRSLLLDPQNTEMIRETELLLYIAARAQMAKEVIEPALNDGKIVICDRYDLSTFTYQYVFGKWGSMAPILNVSSILKDLPSPDWYFVLDLPVEVSRQRLGKDLDRQEQRGEDEFNKIRSKYLEYAEMWNHVSVIDASKSPEEVSNATIKELNRVVSLLNETAERNEYQ